MFVYDKEVTEQLNAITGKSHYVTFIMTLNNCYFKFPFKRSYTKESLLELLNDPKKFDEYIYKDIRENISLGSELRVGSSFSTLTNLKKSDGSAFLQNMEFYCYKNPNQTEASSKLLILFITNKLESILKPYDSLQKYGYIFTDFYYNTRGDFLTGNRRNIQLFLHKDFLKPEETEKYIRKRGPAFKIVSDLYIGL